MKKIVVLGDSHTQYFRREPTLARVYHWENFFQHLECHVFQSASVKGFGKRDSTLNLKGHVVEKLAGRDVAVLNFGQVDIELGIYFKRFIQGEEETLDQFMDECIQAYQVLLDIVKASIGAVVIKGVNSPVLVDQLKAIRYTHRIITENLKDKAAIDRAIRVMAKNLPDIFERISFSNEFNQRLQALARTNAIEYFDINEEISYPNGLIREEFMPASFDHHLSDNLKIRLIHLEGLKKVIGNIK